ncbi:MAG: type II toxin-antitoxin system VapC family toxin [Verrucomicrobia bacterium]|nr:type II toxin-antitoxin system VapC family toxin [Verrucomicrobiota bacterium]MDA1085398.1 type II toxin-antitoxin system VapC family toxin [Verrucomicrobiota bacterium]
MILDTNAISALAGKDPDLIRKLRDTRRVAVTLINLGEYKFGIAHSREKAELTNWLNSFLSRADVLCPDVETSDYYADVRTELKKAGTPIPANDCWIAAITRQHGMPILSRDQHFDLVDGIHRIEW